MPFIFPPSDHLARRLVCCRTFTRALPVYPAASLRNLLCGALRPHRSYYRKLWIGCGNEKGGVPFRVDNANPGGSRGEGDATDVEGSGKDPCWGRERRAVAGG